MATIPEINLRCEYAMSNDELGVAIEACFVMRNRTSPVDRMYDTLTKQLDSLLAIQEARAKMVKSVSTPEASHE